MSLRSRFVAGLQRSGHGRLDWPTPSLMCQVTAELLGAGGAGLVMSQRLVRLPVGADSQNSRLAEEIQASLGEGPCLTAEASQAVLAANEADLALHWPVYHLELTQRTPYRSTLSFPLVASGSAYGALNVYSGDPCWALEEELPTIQAEVVDLIGALLLLHGHHLLRDPDEDPEDSDTPDEPGPRGDRGGPRKHADRVDPQSAAATTDARLQVSVAVGMLQAATDASDVDAIALLRGYAFREGRLIDAVAADLVQRRLPTDRIVTPEQ